MLQVPALRKAANAIALLTVVLFLASGCRKNKDDGGGGDDPPGKPTMADMATMLNTQEAAILEWEKSWKAHKDSLRAAFDMGQWLLAQPGVARVYILDPWHTDIHYASGLRSSIKTIPLDAASNRRYRDGALPYGKGSIKTYRVGGQAKTASTQTMPIGNNKVLLFNPCNAEFYSTYPYLLKFYASPVELEVTVVNDRAATFDVVKTFHQYGLIIINTHGNFEGSFDIPSGIPSLDVPAGPRVGRWSTEELTKHFEQAGGPELQQLILSGKLTMSLGSVVRLSEETENRVWVSFAVTDDYIATMPNKLKDAVVFGNHCYSGGTAPARYQGDEFGGQNHLTDAWLQAGAAAYYGYSFADGTTSLVETGFAKRVEGELIQRLVADGDSTGIAHLDAAGAEHRFTQERSVRSLVMATLTAEEWQKWRAEQGSARVNDDMLLKHYHSPEYAYGCGTFTDPRDGQKYKLACIGSQVWMAENLRYNAPGSRIYDGNSANLSTYGRLYNYSTASAGGGTVVPTALGLRGICPQGWHLPSKRDIDTLLATMIRANGTSNTGIQLKSASPLWIGDNNLAHPLRNKWGFAAVPSGIGFGNPSTASYSSLGEEAYFWLSSRHSFTDPNDVFAVYGFFAEEDDIIFDQGATTDDGWFVSCRCVKD